MRAAIIAIAAALLAGPALAQTAPQPSTPPATAAPPATEASPSIDIVVAARPLGRSTGDREIEEVTLRAVPVVISPVRGRTEQVSDIVRAGLGELRAAVTAAGLTPAGPAMTVYLEIGDSEFAAELMIPVAAAPATPPQGMRNGMSPEGRAIRMLHSGSYDELNDTFDELSTFIEDQDLQVRDMVIERYLTDGETTAPEDLRTEVYVLLR